MINKISNLKLILGLVLLGLVYLAVVFFDSSKSAELEKELVSIDTSKVTQLTIDNAQETVNLYRNDQSWQVALTTGKRVTVVTDKVNSLLEQLIDIRTDRLAAKDESKWADYQVDSTGTHIQVQEGDLLTLDMTVGTSGSTSYLRLAGEAEVYASDNFKGLLNQDQINNYRDNTFIRMKTDSIESIAFNYPGDSSFQIIQNGGTWNFADGTAADSIKIVDYLKELNLKYNDNFALQDGSTVGPKVAEILINSKNQAPVTISALVDPSDSVVYHCNLNEQAYFNDAALGDSYFIQKSALLTDLEEE